MISVIICGVVNSAMLVGLGAGIIVGFIEARTAIMAALAFDPSGTVRRVRSVWARPATVHS